MLPLKNFWSKERNSKEEEVNKEDSMRENPRRDDQYQDDQNSNGQNQKGQNQDAAGNDNSRRNLADQEHADHNHADHNHDDHDDEYYDDQNGDYAELRSGSGKYRDEIFSKRVPAGKRTYFFDVKTTRSGRDYFLTITESKRIDEHRYEKHKIFLYKEDFGKFVSSMHEVVRFIQDECLPGYEFRGLPDVSANPGELDEAYTGDGDSY